MSSNIQIIRLCRHCGKEFKARTTVTQYCSNRCNKAVNKARERAEKIDASNKETERIRNRPIEDIKAKEFLTVRDVARLLNCSTRSVYRYIDTGNMKAVNLGQRVTRIKRSEIDQLFV